MMKRSVSIGALCYLPALALVACDGGDAVSTDTAARDWDLPYQRLPVDADSVVVLGLEDRVILESIEGGMGRVVFSHLTHASSAEDGYGIPCHVCHHYLPETEALPAEGCTGCHKPPHATADPAHGGPDDNMLLIGDDQDPTRVLPVPFTHFTHASSQGHKIPCASCHHTGDLAACGECHAGRAVVVHGDVMPREKRAFHLQCKTCHQAFNTRLPEPRAPETCDGCHTGEQPRRLAGSLSLDRAYHLQCVGCHQRVNLGTGSARAPAGECNECHLWGFPFMTRAGDREVLGAHEEGEPPGGPRQEDLATDEEHDPGPAELWIDVGEDLKPPTLLDHHGHQALTDDCLTCHHFGLDEPTCSGCHEAEEAKGIYHDLCIGCHSEEGASTRCGACHPMTSPAQPAEASP